MVNDWNTYNRAVLAQYCAEMKRSAEQRAEIAINLEARYGADKLGSEDLLCIEHSSIFGKPRD